MVCYIECEQPPEKDGECTGPCFTYLKSGTVEVHALSDDARSFELSFEFEVADEDGAVIKVSDGKARTRD